MVLYSLSILATDGNQRRPTLTRQTNQRTSCHFTRCVQLSVELSTCAFIVDENSIGMPSFCRHNNSIFIGNCTVPTREYKFHRFLEHRWKNICAKKTRRLRMKLDGLKRVRNCNSLQRNRVYFISTTKEQLEYTLSLRTKSNICEIENLNPRNEK